MLRKLQTARKLFILPFQCRDRGLLKLLKTFFFEYFVNELRSCWWVKRKIYRENGHCVELAARMVDPQQLQNYLECASLNTFDDTTLFFSISIRNTSRSQCWVRTAHRLEQTTCQHLANFFLKLLWANKIELNCQKKEFNLKMSVLYRADSTGSILLSPCSIISHQ